MAIGTISKLQGVLFGISRSTNVFVLHSAEGLSCFDRVGDEVVPGCIGFGGSTWDYCYDPSATDKELNFIGFPPEPEGVWDYFELNQCEGDCDFDSGKCIFQHL